MHVALDANLTATTYSVFAEGWLNADGTKWGRPVGLLRLPDGSMLVADDTARAVYRVSYDPAAAAAKGGAASLDGAPQNSGAAGGGAAAAAALTASAAAALLLLL